MKKIVVVIAMFCCIHALNAQQYYKKGVWWAEGSSNPYHLERAFDCFKQGEAQGEPESAECLIHAYLAGVGTVQNTKEAIRLMNKWYDKRKEICLYAAYFFMPRRSCDFKPRPDDLWCWPFGSLEDRDAVYYKHSYDISQALKFAKYANQNYEPDQFCECVEAYCYETGACGYKQDTLKAVSLYISTREVRQVNQAWAIRKLAIDLVDRVKNFDELLYTLKGLFPNDSIPDDFLLGFGDFDFKARLIKKRDILYEEFLNLNEEEKNRTFVAFDPAICSCILAIYEDDLQRKIDLIIGGNLVLDRDRREKELNKINEYLALAPDKSYLEVYRSRLASAVAKKLVELQGYPGIRIFESLVAQKHICNYPDDWSDILSNEFERIYKQTKDQVQEIYGIWNRGGSLNNIEQEIRILGRYCDGLKFIMNKISIDSQNLMEINSYLSLADSAKEMLIIRDFSEVNGAIASLLFNKDISIVSKSYEKVLTQYPDSFFSSYVKSKIKKWKMIERDLITFLSAYNLGSKAKGQEIKAVLALPMSPRMKSIVNALCDKKYIKQRNKLSETARKRDMERLINNYYDTKQ